MRKIESDRKSPLISLNPLFDENRILRVGGRLANATMEFNRKFRMIIRAHPLVTLLIQHFHGKCLHGGTQFTLNLLGPFSQVGIDYAGPVPVTVYRGRGYKSHSSYIAVFICFAVRAIHLELVSDYSSAAFGEIWEAGVRSVKHHLRRVLLAQTPSFEELTTLFCQIEACLNSRPLYPLSNDPEDLKVLTPGHFLIGGELIAVS